MVFKPYNMNITVGDLVYFSLDVEYIVSIGVVVKKNEIRSFEDLDNSDYFVYWPDTQNVISYKRYMINKF